MALGNHHAFVGLNTLLVALADANTNAHGVAHVDLREIILLLSRLKGANQSFRAQFLGRGTGSIAGLRRCLRCCFHSRFGVVVGHRCVLRIGCHPSSALNRQTMSVPFDAIAPSGALCL